jgi:hypothetical protein
VTVDAKEQELYCSGVGMPLYLVKHSTPATMNELKRVIEFVLDTWFFGLKIEPKLNSKEAKWTMTVYTNSEYTGDKETRISVGGYFMEIEGSTLSYTFEGGS